MNIPLEFEAECPVGECSRKVRVRVVAALVSTDGSVSQTSPLQVQGQTLIRSLLAHGHTGEEINALHSSA